MKNKHAVALGKMGGKAGRGKSKARSSEQARAAALAGWRLRHARENLQTVTDRPHLAETALSMAEADVMEAERIINSMRAAQ